MRAFARLQITTTTANIRKEIQGDIKNVWTDAKESLNIPYHVDYENGTNMAHDCDGLYKKFNRYFVDNDRGIKLKLDNLEKITDHYDQNKNLFIEAYQKSEKHAFILSDSQRIGNQL